MKTLLATALLAVAVPAAAQTPSIAKLDSVFSQFRRTDGPGCAVAVSRNGETLAAKGYGMADMAQGIAINPQSIFHVASVSKQFTAMSLVLLAASGKISLEDDIRKYIPELPTYGQPITIHHILTHTSGLRDQWNLLMTAGWRLGDDIITEQDVLDIVTRQRGLNFAPGTSWNYSNTGFTLAAVIVKRATGKSLREYAEEVLFKPLGMSRTHFHDDNSMIVPGRTRGYTYRNGEWHENVPNYSTVGATSLFTTVTDLVQWQKELDEGTVGGQAALQTLFRQAVLVSGDTLQYALGISHGTYRGLPTINHSGGDPGYRTYVLHFPTLKAGVSVLCNLNEANPVRLAEQTAEVYFGNEMRPEQPASDSTAAGPLTTATGLYWSDQGENAVEIVSAGGTLRWKPGFNSVALHHVGDRSYTIGTGAGKVIVEPDGRLKVISGNGEPSWYTKGEKWTPTGADRAAIAGRYASDEIGVVWEIRTSGDSVLLVRRKFPPAPLVAIYKDTYRAASSLPFVIRAQRDKSGKVTGITVGSGRVRGIPFKRVPAGDMAATLY